MTDETRAPPGDPAAPAAASEEGVRASVRGAETDPT